jgi:hypothetical protein
LPRERHPGLLNLPQPQRLETPMPEPDRNSISTRLWRLPGQLFLALINATAILVIVAAILALVWLSQGSSTSPEMSPRR